MTDYMREPLDPLGPPYDAQSLPHWRRKLHARL